MTYSKEYYLKNKERIKLAHKKHYNIKRFASDRFKRYGISLEQYKKLFEVQNGLCLGCYKHQKGLIKRLYVDHCHETGKIRGLLCGNCNFAIGQAKEQPEILRRLADYVERNR